MRHPTISVVTPTYRRPGEVEGMLQSLSKQTCLPVEVILVDGAPATELETEIVVRDSKASHPFPIHYMRHTGGTAIQRNKGIEHAKGDFVAFVDDDIRLDPGFFDKVMAVFENDNTKSVGGIVGYRTNEHFHLQNVQRWRWYKRLGLLTTYEPGRYDFLTGYPINANMQPPFSGVRTVDFMTTACAVWRREVLDTGLRFHTFFKDYGILEDAHFSLRAGREWKLLQCGDAHCIHRGARGGRASRRLVGYRNVVNYWFVFQDVVGPLTIKHKVRFWRYQLFELLRIAGSAVRRQRIDDAKEVLGRLQGFLAAARGIPR